MSGHIALTLLSVLAKVLLARGPDLELLAFNAIAIEADLNLATWCCMLCYCLYKPPTHTDGAFAKGLRLALFPSSQGWGVKYDMDFDRTGLKCKGKFTWGHETDDVALHKK
ncbi:hypothetical protein EDB85DRAFT_1896569 [Lactarius pseudohatsudake]|nr:hypothetical protein EDB85DRAFT_1896569 [Lactarius pseudohatsudake]